MRNFISRRLNLARGVILGAFAVISLALLPGCAGGAPPTQPVFLLLGEVHDNPDGHARRLADLQALVEGGWRPAIVMEQFDLDRNDALQAARQSCQDADCIIAQAGGPRWNWSFYRPVIELALKYDLPLVAGNLSRADASRVVRGGLDAAFTAEQRAAFGLSSSQVVPSLPAELLAVQQDEVQRGHCGLAPATMLPGLAQAQIARDIGMAQAMLPYAGHGVVLLAGNGHVRKDIGVPFWLRRNMAAQVRAVAYAEPSDEGSPAWFDATVAVPPFVRPDPCAALKMPAR